MYVLNTVTEAPEANATARAIMALTALSVGLYLSRFGRRSSGLQI
jgi:hypothetical protein